MTLNADFQSEIKLQANLDTGQKNILVSSLNNQEGLSAQLRNTNKEITANVEKEITPIKGSFTKYQTLSGYTPVKGKDYFTEAEIDEIARIAYEMVQIGGANPKDFIKKSQIGRNLEIDNEGNVNVLTTDVAEGGNAKPITSSAVNTIVGNIDVLLGII